MLDKDRPEPCQRVSVQQWIEDATPTDDKFPKDDGEAHAERGTPTRLGSWRTYELNSSRLHGDPGSLSQSCAESAISIFTASANLARRCQRCQRALTDAFGIPPEWWSRYYKNANGYFGCVEQQDTAGLPTIDTWARFQTKQEDARHVFYWEKVHVFTRRVPSLGRTVVVLFDMAPPVVERLTRALRDADPAQHVDPLWVYVRVADELAAQADTSVWAIRDHVRAIEKEQSPAERDPDFRRLHDLARHAIHVTETLDVTVQTLEAVLAQHKELKRLATASHSAGGGGHDAVWQAVQQRLLAPKQLLDNQRCRAQANQARLQNEIQLAFNGVALLDSRASVALGRAARADSAAMKTVSLLTLVFLPPTFICAVFSMSFFNYDVGGEGWSVSPRFWLYWAFAVPLTIVSALVCYYWQAAFPPAPPRAARPREPSFAVGSLPT